MATIELVIDIIGKNIRGLILIFMSLGFGCNSSTPADSNNSIAAEGGYTIFYIPFETDFFDATTISNIGARSTTQKNLKSENIDKIFAYKKSSCTVSSEYPLDLRVKITRNNLALYIDSDKKFSDGKVYCKFSDDLTTKVIHEIEEAFKGSVEWPASKLDGKPVPVKTN